MLTTPEATPASPRGLPLRPYQRAAIDAVYTATTRGIQRPLIKLPTGGGKTIVFSHLLAERGGRALILAHREELVAQAADKLRQVAPHLPVGIVKAERDEHTAQVVVGSVQTLAHPARLARVGQFHTVVVDEAHHATAPTYLGILERLGAWQPDGPLTLGVTATPMRGDRVGLDAVWQEIVYDVGILRLITQGYLCDVRGLVVSTPADLARIKVRHGDFVAEDVGEELVRSGALDAIADAYLEHAPDRKALAFTPTVATAYALAAALTDRGILAEGLDGTTHPDQRRAALFRSRMRWLPVDDGYTLPAGEHTILLVPTPGGTWQVVDAHRSKPTTVADRLSVEYATGLGEDLAREHGLQLATRDAAWRDRPASDRQLAALRRAGVRLPARGRISSGQASDALSRLHGQRLYRQLRSRGGGR